jgi:EAL domain-containing protein (putative c-di-GMP-specific phosphodiesterase class I)
MSLVYQPVVELSTGRVQKAEALLRWKHPELGAVSPAEFVPIAEGTGLIGEIGQWVLTSACAQAAQWRRRIDPAFRIAINHSPLQFRSDTGTEQTLAAQLQQHGLSGEALVVEITEGLLLEHSDDLARQLHDLRSLGVQIALDDFGTGYSSLAYLHRYPIDLLKIDRSFISGAAAGHTGRSLCRAMVALASELDLQVVAEGVETEEQEQWLRGIGCQHAQGWHYARAMPPLEFERWLLARHPGAAADAEIDAPPSRETNTPGRQRVGPLDPAGPLASAPSANPADRPRPHAAVVSTETASPG